MSPIGRIFIVVNLVLAALFLGWSATNLGTAQDFKRRLDSKAAELTSFQEQKEAEITGLRAEKSQLENARGTLREERDNLAAERDRLKNEYEAERDRNAALSTDIAGIKELLGSYDETNRQLQQRYEQAVADARSADASRAEAEDAREAALEAQRAAEERVTSAEKRIASLETDLTSAREDLQVAETQLETIIAQTGVSAADLVAMPSIDGAVVSVDPSIDPGLVAINKGANDGVKRGFTFDVYSGSQYKGQVRVESVQPAFCMAVIVKTVDGRTILQGDRASTNI